MPIPYAAIAQGASIVASIMGGSAEERARRRQQQMANRELARILPVQRSEFNSRYNLTNVLNQLLLDTDATRYNEVGGREIAIRGALGDESRARFDEQADAVNEQVGTNRVNVRALLDSLQASTQGGIGAYEAERGRQQGFQGEADAAALALPSNIGSAADAVARAAAATRRSTAATGAIGVADTGGYAPETHSRVVEEFARRGTEARDTAVSDATKAAEAGAYGDARSEADRTIGAFADMVDRLKAKSAVSSAALKPELALFDRRGKNALGTFDGQDAMSKLLASGKTRLADTYHTGRMAAIGDAGGGELDSLNNLFARLNENYRTGYGGQVQASERYTDLFTQLINQKASRIMGQQVGTSSMTSLGSLLGSLSSMIPGG